MTKPVLIVGGGLSGLACAATLAKAGTPFELFEASERWGGRAGSEQKDGYILDRGFQVFLDAYPVAAELLDFSALALKPFASGARVATPAGMKTLADPFRHPGKLFATLAGPLPPADLLRLGRLTLRLKQMTVEQALSVQDITTLEFLKSCGFSEAALERFWRPFLGGIFLESDLTTSARMFHFVFSLFSRGRATLPCGGMQAIPDQLAAALPADALHLNTKIVEVEADRIRLENGSWIEGAAVVDARDPWQPSGVQTKPCGTACFYFSADELPWEGPWLVLCPKSQHINTLTDLTRVQPGYAPPGKRLVSVSSLNPAACREKIENDLTALFGDAVQNWTYLDCIEVPYALPAQPVGHLTTPSRTVRPLNGIWRCGDFLETASIEGALRSGKQAAERLMTEFRN
jgi:hypothetical protein